MQASIMENRTTTYSLVRLCRTSETTEVENLIRIIGSNEEKIMNYFKTGKTNAKAEAINSKIQRFITANYGVRDKDFFLYRLAHYYS